MSGIAEVLLNLGYTISGSDVKLSPITERLAGLGARVFEGHAASNIAGARALVISSAVDEQNPEVLEARRLQIPVIPRGELLAELMRLKYGIAVAGSHGKTTTTSMTATILNHAGLDPTVVVGGRVGSMGGSNARVGHSDFLVVESDESDGSFLKLSPIIAVVTNIDREHLDHYPSLEDIEAAFIEFVNKTPFYGACIVCLDDPNVQAILPAMKRRIITYGASTQADMQAGDIGCGHFSSDFSLRYRGADLGRFHLRVPGHHNVLNAMAAACVALELEVKPDAIREALAAFTGRRQALSVARPGTRRHRRRRLRPPSHRDPRNARWRARLRIPPHPRAVPAASLYAHRAFDGRIRPRLSPGRFRIRDGYLRGVGEAHRRRHRRGPGRSHPPVRSSGSGICGHAGTWGRCAINVVEDHDMALTLGAGNVWQAGEMLLERIAGPGLMAREKKTPSGIRWRLWFGRGGCSWLSPRPRLWPR